MDFSACFSCKESSTWRDAAYLTQVRAKALKLRTSYNANTPSFFNLFQFFCLCSGKQVVLFFLCSPAGDNVFNPKEDTYRQSKILTLLLSKSLAPIEKDDPLGERSLRRFISKAQSSNFFCSDCNVFLSAGLELATKLAELEEVRT